MIYYAKKIIVVHPPRTGGSSFETLLRRNAIKGNWKKQLLFRFYDPVKLESPFYIATKHLKCSQVRAIVGADYYDTAKKIGFLRNPYDRVISHYNYFPYRNINALSGKSLKYFLENYKPKDFEYGISLSDYYDDDIDLFIRFESYQQDLLDVCNQLGLDPLIRHEAKTKRRSDWESYYDRESIAMVNEIFADDFRRFNYEMI